MTRLGEIVQLQTQAGAPTRAGNITVTPESQSFSLRLPFGGFVWNRPTAVVIEIEGERQRVPVVDVTRIAQLAVAGFTIGLILWSRAGKRKESNK